MNQIEMSFIAGMKTKILDGADRNVLHRWNEDQNFG
ncbi:hypothetical protein J2S19_002372 [Metabacillus malikii]|uniref:Uncharacterized protein n=1 Tax=Metabacillus malikii TaxID=1504265 RepID=A0ABT9ZIQ4_9BACI|nr:hypothetical protein [Metabacillus malikii]